jgi:hypothetical protein
MLSAAKHLLYLNWEQTKQMLRCAQHDMFPPSRSLIGQSRTSRLAFVHAVHPSFSPRTNNDPKIRFPLMALRPLLSIKI